MSYGDLLLDPEMYPFSIALLLVACLFMVELAGMLVGLSVLGAGETDTDLDLDAEVDIDADFETDFDPDLDISAETGDAIDTGGAVAGDADAASEMAGVADASGWTQALTWLGVGRVPLMIWVAGLLSGFGLAGYFVQVAVSGLTGALLPAGLAVALALLPGLIFASRFAGMIARVVPKTETSAVSRRHFGGRRGVLVQGTAQRGRPAQARFKDRHGNTHYVLVEPFEDAESIAQGEDIVILRTRAGDYRALRLDDSPSG
ncbi:MAG: OB-fold-containig protein [Pseudomonadota bacterium]